MARKLRPRRGNTAQNNAYTGAAAEITIDTTKKTLVVHDGATAGGNPLPTFADISSLIGVPSGIAGLDAGGKVPSAQLPSYVDDVLEFANLAALPATGETGKIYVALDTSKTYRWSGSVYVAVGADGDLLLTYADAFADVVLSGLVFPTSATRTSTMTSGVAEVIGTRVVVPATANTFTASRDTYVDLSKNGVLTYVGVANTILIEDCEDAWNESVDADATVSVVADVAAGQTLTNSNKIVVAATAVAGDVLATEAIASLNLSTATAARWWIKSSIATAAGDLHLLLGETAIVTTANAAEILAVPALTANTWTQVQVNFAGATTARDAIISVGLRYTVDIGACNLFIDDVQGIIPAPAAPAVTANSLRLQKVVTSSTAVTSVVQIASRELTANRNVSVPAPTLGGHATNKDFVSAELSAHNAAADPHTGYALESTIGVANGIAGLDGTGKVPAAQLPSYVDDVLEYASLAAFPASGETGKIYIAQDTGASYRWTGTVYIKLSDDDVLQFANLAAFPASGVGAALYIAEDTNRIYRWNGAAYVLVSGLDAIPTMTMLGNNTGGSAVPTALTKGDVQTLLDIGWLLQSRSVASPNATVPAHRLIPVGAEANIDVVLAPKGTGAVLLNTPDNAVAGGTKRGARAIDLQMYRGDTSQVASGADAVALGYGNVASNQYSLAIGNQNTVSGSTSSALGLANALSGTWSFAIGKDNTVAGGQSIAVGESNSVAGSSSGAFGTSNKVQTGKSNAFAFGKNNDSTLSDSYLFGLSNSGGGYLFGGGNSGTSSSCTALGTSNTPKNGVLVGVSNTQAGDSGKCYAFGGSNSFTDVNAASMVLGSNNTISGTIGSVVVGNLANVHWREDYAIIRSLRGVEASKTSHVREVHPGGITTDATVTPLTIGTSLLYASDKVLLLGTTVNLITATFVAISSADRKTWKVEASVYLSSEGNTPIIDVQTITAVYGSAGATAWNLTLTAATQGVLDFNATGVAATTIKWLGKVEITQLQL